MAIPPAINPDMNTELNHTNPFGITKDDLSVSFAGLTLKNPVIPASGCFGYGYEMNRYYDLNILGGISIKGTTLNPRFGNPAPRVAECRSGMLNSVGLQNPGIDAVINRELPKLREVYDGIVFANISGFAIEEYVETVRRMCESGLADAIELNVSCPNVHGGGMSFGTDPEALGAVVKAVKKVCTLPLIVKLTPNVTDITVMARCAEENGADGICLINTLLGMRFDLKRQQPVTSRPMAGMSGPAVFPIALRMVWQAADAVSIPVIGCGGVSSADDVLEMMLAGAKAVEIGTANLLSPTACPDIIRDLRHHPLL